MPGPTARRFCTVSAMVLYEESGVDGKDLTVYVKLNAVTILHISILGQVGYKVVLNPTHGYESGGVVWDEILCVDCSLEYTAILVDGVLRVRDDGNPLRSV